MEGNYVRIKWFHKLENFFFFFLRPPPISYTFAVRVCSEWRSPCALKPSVNPLQVSGHYDGKTVYCENILIITSCPEPEGRDVQYICRGMAQDQRWTQSFLHSENNRLALISERASAQACPYSVRYHPHVVFYICYLTQELFCLSICGQNTGAVRATYDVYVPCNHNNMYICSI